MNCRLASLLFFALLLPAQTDWPVYGHDPGGMRFSPLDQITPANVGRLERAWTYRTGDMAGLPGGQVQKRAALETTPLVIDGVMYLSTAANRVVALRPETGEEIWTYDPRAGMHGKPAYQAHRGVSYWPGGKGLSPRILFGTSDGRLISLDAQTGKPAPEFGDNGAVNLRNGVADAFPKASYAVTSPPAIYQDLVITGASVPEGQSRGPRGDVRAFDVRSGKLVWQFHTVPQPGDPGHETWEGQGWKDRTGANVWSIMTVDPERGLVFLPIGSPSYDFYGADRKGQNLYGNSLVALEARTGKLRWFYQMVHHDVWDYDLPAPPALITVRQGGRSIPAVVQVTKMGLMFILHRETGKPLYAVEEVAAPRSDVPGEVTWPTQPVPVKPPPLSRSTFSREDLTDVTPESRKYCSELLDQVKTAGRYTPYGLETSLVFPGTLGGATWSGVSFHPELGYAFVNTNEAGAVGRLEKQPDGSDHAYARTSAWGAYARFWDPNMWPCQKPPWGLLQAVNVNTGEIAWKVPLGVIDELEKRGVPKTGAPNMGGSIVTAGGLVFIGATNDSRFRAFEAKTGKEVWVTRIEGSAHATPITYRGRDGRQYVVIAAGGGGFFGSAPSDAVAAWALPKK